jgi:uncharacterized protein (DUF58 family)
VPRGHRPRAAAPPPPPTGPGAPLVLDRPNRPPSLSVGPTADVLRRLELLITRRLDGLLQGDHRGLVPGHGSELGETREYQPGDDVRRIDWNVTARTVTPHIRQTIADRELETWAFLDVSPSMHWGTADCEKRDLALAAVSAVGLLTARSGNRVGAVTHEGRKLSTIPARSGRGHLQILLHRLAEAAKHPPESVDLVEGVERLNATMRRRGLAVIVSDFMGPRTWVPGVRRLAARHEVLAVEVGDPHEVELPDVGVVRLVDPETGAELEVQTARGDVRERFAAAARAERDDLARTLRTAGVDHLTLRTDRDWLVDLVRFVTVRRDRVDALSRIRR